jgi:hypothetical protein
MKLIASLCLALGVLCATRASADTVTDWNLKSNEVIAEARLATQPAVRVMAIVQTAAHRAVVTASHRGASVDAALAAAHRMTLTQLLPAQQAMVEAAYQAALGAITDQPAKLDGIADGEAAARSVLATRPRRRATGRTPRPVSTCRSRRRR